MKTDKNFAQPHKFKVQERTVAVTKKKLLQ